MSNPDQSLPLAITSAPRRIWLDLGFDPREEDAHFSNLHDLTWSSNNATGDGIEYVRADLAPTEAAAMAATVPDGSEGEAFWTTGHADADRLIGRLLSDDPDFDDCTEAAVLLRKLVLEEIKGPDGHATWKDAAIAERAARAQAPVADQPAEPSPAGMTCAQWINTALAELDGVDTDDENNCLSAARSALTKALAAAPKGDSNG